MKTTSHSPNQAGFTLIELSIVLVIIGLIAGGVLVGQDLIKAATIRSQIDQLEEYDSAANTFRTKYNGLPGDLVTPAAFFSTIVATGANGHADGDSLIEGASAAATVCTTAACLGGENAIFFSELSLAGMIKEPITTVTAASYTLTPSDNTLPAAKVGRGARVHVQAFNGTNRYVIGNFGTAALVAGSGTFTAALTPLEASNLDVKMDDGNPSTGKMISTAVTLATPATPGQGAVTASVVATTCYDSTTNRYTTTLIGTFDNKDSIVCSATVRTSF